MCWNENLLGFSLERYCPFARLLLVRLAQQSVLIRPLRSVCLKAGVFCFLLSCFRC